MTLWFYCSHFILDIYNALLDLIMPEIAQKLGISIGFGVLILNIVYIAGNGLQPLWGYLADKTNKRVFVFWGLVLAAVFLPLTVIVNDVYTLILCVFLGAIGISFYHPQAMGAVKNNMGVFFMAGSLGFSFAPVLTLFVSKHLGYEGIPYISVLGIFAALLLLFLPNKKHSASKKQKKIPIKLMLRKRRMRKLTLISIGTSSLIAIVGQILPFLWKEIGRDMSYSGIGLFVFYMSGAIGGVCVNSIRKKIGRANTFYFAFIAGSLSIVLFLLTIEYLFISLFFVSVIGFISMGLAPLIITTGQQLFPMYKSSISGLLSGFCYAIACMISVGAAFLCDILGVTSVFMMLSAVPLACTFLVKSISLRSILFNIRLLPY